MIPMDDLYVLKFGGNAIRGKEAMLRLGGEIAQMMKDGAKVILVHGGGPEISEEMERRGLKPKKVAGVRVTDADGLEVSEKVLSNLNKDVVECLTESGVQAIGMPGYHCTLCVKKAPVETEEDGKKVTVDMGLVGEVSECDPTALMDLLEMDIVPVIYPIGKDKDGNKLNVNADTMVAGIAANVSCKEMIAITDVPGILMDVNDPGSKLDKVTLKDIDDLIGKGVISGGMVPKVEACRKAILAGVSEVRMVNGTDPECIVADVMKEGSLRGTVITK
ncbi:MAG: acetylglutamate kinase [Candidatus Methanomethylophilaceae archaeon]|nr:acetylglutamate kinase [Candidatus Methanomethylophilaceae archaeon]